MSELDWGLEVSAWRLRDFPGGGGVGADWLRWDVQLGTTAQQHPLQVQGIPGEYQNDYHNLFFSRSGAWYVTVGDNSNPPGVVFYAPFTTGEFREVVRLVDRGGESLVPISYPDGLVVGRVGSRWVSILTEGGGLVSEQELPPIPVQDELIQPLCVVCAPSGGRVGLLMGASIVPEAPPGEWPAPITGGCFTDLVAPGQPMGVVGELYIAQGPAAILAIAADLYGEPTILGVWERMSGMGGVGRSYRNASGTAYMFIVGDEASGSIPVQLMEAQYNAYDDGEMVWPGTSEVGRFIGIGSDVHTQVIDAPPTLYDLEGASYGFGLYPMWRPPFVRPPFWTAFVQSEEIVGVGTPPDPGPAPDPGPEPGEQYADVIMHAEDYGPPGQGYTGFRAEIPGELEGFGSAAPLQFYIGGVECTLDEINHSYAYNETVFSIQGVYGVTGASMVVDGVAFSMEFDTFHQYLSAWVVGAESPFVAGQTYDVRLYLEGDLRSTP